MTLKDLVALPAARAGAILNVKRYNGKFHGLEENFVSTDHIGSIII